MPKVSAFWGDVEASSLGLTYANGQGVPQAERAGRRVVAQGRRPAVRRRAAQPRSMYANGRRHHGRHCSYAYVGDSLLNFGFGRPYQ